MKKQFLSIHKTFLSRQSESASDAALLKLKKTIKIRNPGTDKTLLINKPASMKRKTDKGSQLLTLSSLKKTMNNGKLQNNRLDLVLFNLKFSKSLSESKYLITNKFISVNNVIVTNVNHLLQDYSLIHCTFKNSYINYITHQISNTLTTPAYLLRLNENTGIFYYNPEPNSVLLPKGINVAQLRRMNLV